MSAESTQKPKFLFTIHSLFHPQNVSLRLYFDHHLDNSKVGDLIHDSLYQFMSSSTLILKTILKTGYSNQAEVSVRFSAYRVRQLTPQLHEISNSPAYLNLSWIKTHWWHWQDFYWLLWVLNWTAGVSFKHNHLAPFKNPWSNIARQYLSVLSFSLIYHWMSQMEQQPCSLLLQLYMNRTFITKISHTIRFLYVKTAFTVLLCSSVVPWKEMAEPSCIHLLRKSYFILLCLCFKIIYKDHNLISYIYPYFEINKNCKPMFKTFVLS